jgi:hypothetical protein
VTSRFVLLGLLAVACNRPQPVVICHNGNCTGDADSSHDDTMEALQDSLALGPAIIDGVEIDAVWQDDDCHFAHDVGQADAPLLTVPIATIISYLQENGEPLSGVPFTILLELKAAGRSNAKLDKCANRAVMLLENVSTTTPIHLLISSFDERLLRSKVFKKNPAAKFLDIHFGAEIWPTTELNSLHDDLNFVSVTPSDTSSPSYGTIIDQGFDTALWNEGVTPTLLDDVMLHSPRYVSVGEAAVMRAWIDR